MRLLDLFCGAGGAAMGYYKAGITEIVGVDIEPQPNYPFEFIQGNALESFFGGFDLIHASPPCQRWSVASGKSSKHRGEVYPDLLRPIRKILKDSSIPYVIENVQEAPLYNPLLLCGTMFPNLKVIRHRAFELSFSYTQPDRDCFNHPQIYSPKDPGSLPQNSYITVAGNGNCSLSIQKRAMNIDWMNKKELSQAIPPDYTQYIGKIFLNLV